MFYFQLSGVQKLFTFVLIQVLSVTVFCKCGGNEELTVVASMKHAAVVEVVNMRQLSGDEKAITASVTPKHRVFGVYYFQ